MNYIWHAVNRMKSYAAFLLLAVFVTGTQPSYADDALTKLKGQLKGLYSSFRGNFTYASSGGSIVSGKIYYQFPNKLHVKLSTGGVIATDGRHLWIYNGGSFCAKQEVAGGSGGLLGWLSSYQGSVSGSSYVFKKPGAHYDEVVVQVANGMIRSVQLKHEGETSTYSFSGISIDSGIPGSLFSYKPPPSAQVVENPLNN